MFREPEDPNRLVSGQRGTVTTDQVSPCVRVQRLYSRSGFFKRPCYPFVPKEKEDLDNFGLFILVLTDHRWNGGVLLLTSIVGVVVVFGCPSFMSEFSPSLCPRITLSNIRGPRLVRTSKRRGPKKSMYSVTQERK